MRKNTEEVFAAWENHQYLKKADSIWTNGDRIYSYNTLLVERVGDAVILNRTSYSPTTTRHQNGLAVLLRDYARHIVTSAPQGVQDLRPYV